MFFDIHSHILHNIDDGAKDLQEAVSLLKDMYSQGITDVISTPHFYPLSDALEDFTQNAQNRLQELRSACENSDLPNIHLGFEVYYYVGISKAEALKHLTLCGSNYILLEPNPSLLNCHFQKELLSLRDSAGITPILAHIERYHKEKGYRSLLRFIKNNNILTQANASSFLDNHYTHPLKKLIKEGILTFLATDTHSVEHRPPKLTSAFDIIEERFGTQVKQKFIDNSQELFKKITSKRI